MADTIGGGMMARKSLKEILDSCKGKPPWGVRFRVGQAGEGKINKAMGSMMPNEQLKFCRDFLLVMETGRGGDGKACGGGGVSRQVDLVESVQQANLAAQRTRLHTDQEFQ